MTLAFQIALGIIIAIIILIAVPLIIMYGSRFLWGALRLIVSLPSEFAGMLMHDARTAKNTLFHTKFGKQTLLLATVVSFFVVLFMFVYFCWWRGICAPL